MTFDKLPFVKTDTNGQIISTWDVKPTGDYSADCATGRKYFRELAMVMHSTGNDLLLSRVLTGQAAIFANWDGIEFGFHHQMAQEIMVD